MGSDATQAYRQQNCGCCVCWMMTTPPTDKVAKRFLDRKTLLSCFLKYLVAKFWDCSVKDIAAKYIEGYLTLTINTIPDDADIINATRNIAGYPQECQCDSQ